jgi:hypothetical protein
MHVPFSCTDSPKLWLLSLATFRILPSRHYCSVGRERERLGKLDEGSYWRPGFPPTDHPVCSQQAG